MSAYLIEIPGCDDTTRVIAHLTDAEFSTVSQVAAIVTAASEVGCQPTMKIRPATPADLEDDDL